MWYGMVIDDMIHRRYPFGYATGVGESLSAATSLAGFVLAWEPIQLYSLSIVVLVLYAGIGA